MSTTEQTNAPIARCDDGDETSGLINLVEGKVEVDHKETRSMACL